MKHLRIRVKGTNKSYTFKNGETIDFAHNVIRNQLNKEMSYAYSGPKPDMSFDKTVGAVKQGYDAMTPYEKAEIAASFNPILGPPIAVKDAGKFLGQAGGELFEGEFGEAAKSIGLAGLSALGAIPGIPVLGGMTAFHGTPHKVDKFRMDKIGTGEGAQAYGHGLYFAESKDVAGSYTNAGSSLGYLNSRHKSLARDIMKEAGGDLTKGRIIAQKRYAEAPDIGTEEIARTTLNNLEYLASKESSGNLYTVDIPDKEIASFLDWDAPISKQPKAVQEVARKFGIKTTASGLKEARGSDLYEAISKSMRKPPFDTASRNPGNVESSNYLNKLGIKGIKYLDGSSRTSGKGTRNFVVFDEDIVKIIDGADNLPMDEASRMVRAKEQGFYTDMPLYHGTNKDFEAFNLFEGADETRSVSRSPVGKLGVSLATDPKLADEFASRAGGEGMNVIPALHRAKNPVSIDLDGSETNSEIFATVSDAWRQGFDSIKFNNYTTKQGGAGQSFILVKDPNQVRSRHAKFDPKKRKSSNLLAGGAAVAIGGGLLMRDEQYD